MRTTTSGVAESQDRPAASVSVVLPWGCLVPDNDRFGSSYPSRRHRLTERYKVGKEAAHMMALSQVKGPRPRFAEGELDVHMDFYMPDARKRDCTNLLKLINDSLEGVVYTTDFQITSLSWLKIGIDRENPRVEIEVTQARARPS